METAKKTQWFWMDGKMIAADDATIPVLTHGLHYGSSVFEGERLYDGKIFKSREHSERLKRSAQVLGFEIPYSVDELEKIKAEVLSKNGITNVGDNYYVRVVSWRGSDRMGVDGGKDIHTAVTFWPWPAMFKDKDKGIRLIEAPYKRPSEETEPVHSKAAGLYMICTISKNAAIDKGYDDALMLDYRGYLAEATGANLFLVMNGELHTPKPDCFLNGITRQTVMELAKKRGLKVVERHIKPEELANAQEVFLTGSAAEVTPVGHITMKDGKEYGFQVGAITKGLVEDYNQLVRAHVKGATTAGDFREKVSSAQGAAAAAR